jgi:hypothetical protein
VTGLSVLNRADQCLNCWLIGDEVARLDLDDKPWSLKAKTASASPQYQRFGQDRAVRR